MVGAAGSAPAVLSPVAGSLPTVAADVADRIVALRGAGESPISIAMALHVTIGEVRNVLRNAERPPGTPHHGGLTRTH